MEWESPRLWLKLVDVHCTMWLLKGFLKVALYCCQGFCILNRNTYNANQGFSLAHSKLFDAPLILGSHISTAFEFLVH